MKQKQNEISVHHGISFGMCWYQANKLINHWETSTWLILAMPNQETQLLYTIAHLFLELSSLFSKNLKIL